MKIKPAETQYRSIVKSISYRAISVTVDYIVAYLFTRNVAFSAGIVLFVDFYSTVLYYLHERLWAHIHWGRKPHGYRSAAGHLLVFAENSETITSQGQEEGAVSVTV